MHINRQERGRSKRVRKAYVRVKVSGICTKENGTGAGAVRAWRTAAYVF